VDPPDHPPGQPDGEEGAQQQAAQDVEQQILIQGHEGALRLQMPCPTMSDGVLYPEGGLIQRMYGIIAETLRDLQSTTFVLRIVDQSVDIPHQIVGGEFGEHQRTGITLPHRFDRVSVLISIERYTQHRDTPVDALLGSKNTTMRDEELDIRMGQNVVLGHPLLDHHIRGQITYGIILKLPNHLLLELAKGLENQSCLLGRQISAFHIRTHTEVDHSIIGII